MTTESTPSVPDLDVRAALGRADDRTVDAMLGIALFGYGLYCLPAVRRVDDCYSVDDGTDYRAKDFDMGSVIRVTNPARHVQKLSISLHLPHYSTDANAALQVVEAMGKKGWQCSRDFTHWHRKHKRHGVGWECGFHKGDLHGEAATHSDPRAICEAALLALHAAGALPAPALALLGA